MNPRYVTIPSLSKPEFESLERDIAGPAALGWIKGYKTPGEKSHRALMIGPSPDKQIVQLIEKHAEKFVDNENVKFRDSSRAAGMFLYPENVHASIAFAPRIGWDGWQSARRSSTSPALPRVYESKHGP
ncbi:hypothetical protein I317_07702 [Kwoniella heveanensis CBS 569]|nr:hypothetical protein I317_07702 [Kwoniella heveanensis CBS 569]